MLNIHVFSQRKIKVFEKKRKFLMSTNAQKTKYFENSLLP